MDLLYTAKFNIIQWKTMEFNGVQHSTTQHSTTQHSTIQHSTTQQECKCNHKDVSTKAAVQSKTSNNSIILLELTQELREVYFLSIGYQGNSGITNVKPAVFDGL